MGILNKERFNNFKLKVLKNYLKTTYANSYVGETEYTVCSLQIYELIERYKILEVPTCIKISSDLENNLDLALKDLYNIAIRKNTWTEIEIRAIQLRLRNMDLYSHLLLDDKLMKKTEKMVFIVNPSIQVESSNKTESQDETVVIMPTINEFNKTMKEYEYLNILTRKIIEYAISQKSHICIGKAHTIIEKIHEIRNQRRKIKNLYGLSGKHKIYGIKTQECLDIVSKISLKGSVKIKTWLSNREYDNQLIFIDLLHIIENKKRFSLKEAYILLMSLIKYYQEIEYDISDISKIFK